MKEIAEFRINAEFASLLFSENEGKALGDLVRSVEVSTNDPRFSEIGRLQRELRASVGRPFFFGWNLKRKPTAAERHEAKLFSLTVSSTFEPCGEECGTIYDEATACPQCGSGAEQLGPLFLDTTRIPKGKDFARTIAGEVVISRRAAELFKFHKISGVALGPIRMSTGPRQESGDWLQLQILPHSAEIVAPTRVGIDPFDDDPEGQYRCPLGHLLGLNLLSAVSIDESSRGSADVIHSRQFIGMRKGLLRPERTILVSPAIPAIAFANQLKGCSFDIAYFV